MTLPASIRRDASTLSARLPSLIIAARRVAQTVRHGVHGRRRAGSGETFWQFRPFLSGEPSSRVDWRRSAREERAFVREREWEAAHTVWIWFDRSPSMQFASGLASVSKIDRAALLALSFGTAPFPEAVKAPTTVPTTGLRTVAAKDWNEADLEKAKTQLALYIGPMARVIVARAAKTAGSMRELYDVLAAEIPSALDRQKFLACRPVS